MATLMSSHRNAALNANNWFSNRAGRRESRIFKKKRLWRDRRRPGWQSPRSTTAATRHSSFMISEGNKSDTATTRTVLGTDVGWRRRGAGLHGHARSEWATDHRLQSLFHLRRSRRQDAADARFAGNVISENRCSAPNRRPKRWRLYPTSTTDGGVPFTPPLTTSLGRA